MEKIKQPRNTYITQAQRDKLFGLLEHQTELRSGKFSASFTVKEAQKRWQEIADVLNAMPGAQKTWKAWRKTWQDYQSRTKSKMARINKAFITTGGGPPEEELSQFEENVVTTIHPSRICGLEDVHESTVTFEDSVHFVQVHRSNDDNSSLPPPSTQTLHILDSPPTIHILPDSPQNLHVPDTPQTLHVTDTSETPQEPKRRKKCTRSDVEKIMHQKYDLKKDLVEAKKNFYNNVIVEMQKISTALQVIVNKVTKE